MTDIVVRYEPEARRPWIVAFEGCDVTTWKCFTDARRHLHVLNGERLPRISCPSYGRVFPGRLNVWWAKDLGLWFVSRGTADAGGRGGYPTHTAAMTAAHELAKGVGA